MAETKSFRCVWHFRMKLCTKYFNLGKDILIPCHFHHSQKCIEIVQYELEGLCVYLRYLKLSSNFEFFSWFIFYGYVKQILDILSRTPQSKGQVGW